MKTSMPTGVAYAEELVMLDYHIFTTSELARFTATAMEAARESDGPLPVAQHISKWEASEAEERARRNAPGRDLHIHVDAGLA
jgi:hypothetical protein